MTDTQPTAWDVAVDLRRQGVPAAAAMAYGVLWMWADRQPGHIIVVSRALGSALGCDRRAADKWVDTLARYGVVAIVGCDGGGRRHVYVYRPRVGAAADSPPPAVDPQMRLPLAGDTTAGGAPSGRADGAPAAPGAPSARPDGAPGAPSRRADGAPTPGDGPIAQARLRTDCTDDDVDVVCAAGQIGDIRRRLRLRRIDRRQWDVVATAVVLTTGGDLPGEWLSAAVDGTARRMQHGEPLSDVVGYLRGCLRRGLAEVAGVCDPGDVHATYGVLWRRVRPAVAAVATHVRTHGYPSRDATPAPAQPDAPPMTVAELRDIRRTVEARYRTTRGGSSHD